MNSIVNSQGAENVVLTAALAGIAPGRMPFSGMIGHTTATVGPRTVGRKLGDRDMAVWQ